MKLMGLFSDRSTKPHGHEHDIQTLIRTAVINNIPIALNTATADYLVQELKQITKNHKLRNSIKIFVDVI